MLRPGPRASRCSSFPSSSSNADGSPGERNDVRCVSLEHKLGIHASPTAVLAFGDGGGAIGQLVGVENRGLEYMFVMMNLARFGVGMQGVGLADRAYQRAVTYARERVQGRVAGEKAEAGATGIIGHPDVRRMLLTMRACSEAARALGYVTAAALDRAHRHPDTAVRERELAYAELMIPIVKGWSTEMAQHVASLGVQVHGGMGYIEESGAAQYLRDARITTIYEGTTGIQANDLIGRKIARDGGRALAATIATMRDAGRNLLDSGQDELKVIGTRLLTAVDALDEGAQFVVSRFRQDSRAVLAGAAPFLELAGIVCAGAELARASLVASRMLAAGDGNEVFLRAKVSTARHFADHCLTHAPGLRDTVTGGAESVLAFAEEGF